MNKEQTLLDALISKQVSLNLDDGHFAKKLGVARTTWIWVRTGGANPGLRFLSGIAKAFPELKPELLKFLEVFESETEKLAS